LSPKPRSLVPTRARSTKRRVEILRAAAVCFRRRGYHGASVEQIAQELGMRKGNLYYYFRDKEEILFFCHDYSLDVLLERLAEVESREASADAKLRQLIVAFVHMILDELHGTALTMDLHALSPAHFEKVVAKRDRFDRGLRAVIRHGVRDGVFHDRDPKLVTFAILGAANWITRWYDPKGPRSSTEIAEAFADYLVAGLLAR
jgi:AcrR family transcriptional regulator